MFGIAALALWILVHLYVYRRMASVPLVSRRAPRWLLASGFVFLAWSYLAARLLERLGAGLPAQLLEFLGATWIGVLFLLFAGFLALDLVTAFGYFWPEYAPRLRVATLLAVAALGVVALVQGMRAPVVRSYEVRLAGLPPEQDGTVIVLLSDMHLGTLLGERWLDARIRQVQEQRPDLIVLAGDIVEGDDQSERALLPALRRLSAPLGVWAVTGNHELHFGEGYTPGVLEEAGVQLLRDRWVELRPGLVLAGVDDLTSRRRRVLDTAACVDRALAGHPSSATVFVSHTPWQAERAAQDGASLMLAAHTHGGQIWPLSYLVELAYPMIGGEYTVEGMPVIVCRGTGTWGPRMRLWRRAEIVRIVLRSQASDLTSRPSRMPHP